MTSYIRHRNETREGTCVPSGRNKPWMLTRRSPAQVRTTTLPAGRPTLPGDGRSETTPSKEVRPKYSSCREALPQTVERAGKPRRLRRFPSLTSRPRPSARGGARGDPGTGSASTKNSLENAFSGGRDPQKIKVSDEPKAIILEGIFIDTFFFQIDHEYLVEAINR